MSFERMTTKSVNGEIICNSVCYNLDDCEACKHFHAMLQRLYELENAIEEANKPAPTWEEIFRDYETKNGYIFTRKEKNTPNEQ